MEELFDTSANSAEVAEPQVETQEISENTSEVADPKPVQDAETNARYAEMRRSQEIQEFRSKATNYEQYLDRVAKLSGYNSHDELMQAVEEAERQQQRQQYEDAGINPDVLNTFLEQHPDIQYAREMRAREQEQAQIQSEVSQLREQFPNIQPDDLSEELFQLKAQKNIPLLHAYLELNYTKLAQQKEQEAIQKLQSNAQSTPGSLGSGDVAHTTNIKNLSSKDFNSLVDQVLRGERNQL